MATGIVAIALQLEGMRPLALVLGWMNAVFFAVLAVLTVAWAIRYRGGLIREAGDFGNGPGFFTIVAGTAILGDEMAALFHHPEAATVLWLLTLPLWVCCMYAIFIEFMVDAKKPSLEAGINGGWLLSVVATQAVADLGALISSQYPSHAAGILFFSLAMWLSGGMLYLWVISLIFYRLTFFQFRPRDFIPSFWINMGAMAISTLAGTTLIARASAAAFLTQMLPFLLGFTVFFWATATWWIPMLALLGYWQQFVKKYGRAYSFQFWSGVFPLGMYTAATYRLAQVLALPFLLWIPRVFVFLALAAWTATLAGMLRGFFKIEHKPQETDRLHAGTRLS